MIYIGSTFTPRARFNNHLVTGKYSNGALQSALIKHGKENFTAYVFEVVHFPGELPFNERKSYLLNLEQQYISQLPKAQLSPPPPAVGGKHSLLCH
jgi:hypothetical protein